MREFRFERSNVRFDSALAGELARLGLTSLCAGQPRTGAYTGVKALMLAVLEDGIRSYLGPAGRARAEAESWVTSSRHRSPFSFRVVCETLGLEPDAVRRAVHRMRARGGHTPAVRVRNRPNVRRGGPLRASKAG